MASVVAGLPLRIAVFECGSGCTVNPLIAATPAIVALGLVGGRFRAGKGQAMWATDTMESLSIEGRLAVSATVMSDLLTQCERLVTFRAARCSPECMRILLGWGPLPVPSSLSDGLCPSFLSDGLCSPAVAGHPVVLINARPSC